MSILTRPILEINLQNLIDNYKNLQKLCSPAEAAAVVKDNAYSLGAPEVSKALYDFAKCRTFFVAHAVEGATIAPLLPDAKIYVLQGIGEDSADLIKKHHLFPVITSWDMFEFWKENRIPSIKPAVYIETGLNRLGFREKDLPRFSEKDKQEFGLVISHLACADTKEHFMNQHQLQKFIELKNLYFPKLKASLSASDGAFLGNDFCFDMVRLGAALYGINTAPYRQNQMKAVVTVKAPVLQISDLEKGEFVGYGATYRAASNKKLAIVSIGYGDGIPRSLSNIGKVYFKTFGQLHEARIIGKISMDNIICDVTEISGLQVGDLAIVLDSDYTLDDIGRDAGTIGYEVLSRLGKNPRYKRIIIPAT